jgi:hypothetical protein
LTNAELKISLGYKIKSLYLKFSDRTTALMEHAENLPDATLSPWLQPVLWNGKQKWSGGIGFKNYQNFFYLAVRKYICL